MRRGLHSADRFGTLKGMKGPSMKRQIAKHISSAIIVFVTASATLLPRLSSAGEADNFTGRHKELAALPDSSVILDQYTNDQLKTAVDRANQTGQCSAHDLYLNLWNLLAHNPISVSERFAESDPRVKKYLVPFGASIYGGVPTFLSEWREPRFADFFIISGWFEPTIRLNHQIIGIDKLGHFFGQGWDYFQSGDLKTALTSGMSDEEGMDGYIGSGVYSYGDLSANYQGLLFWRQLLGGKSPYISCTDKKFRVERRFTWSDYVSPSWDEALNCSKYVAAEMEKSVDDRVHELGLSCPVERSTCAEMVQLPCANLTVNMRCFSVTGASLEAKTKECEALMASENWKATSPTGLTDADKKQIVLDKLSGIALMPFHYLWRDFKSFLFAEEP
jgi:hypothetical protein